MEIKKLQCENYQNLINQYHFSPLCAKVLSSMPYDEKEIRKILFDNTTINEFDLSCFKEVKNRLIQARDRQEKVLVCGDYDCDGVCATTILYDALTKFGISCGYYIPNRFSEGYGLSSKTVQMAYDKGYSVLITVDNGVKATEALSLAKKLGLCIILSDHHSYDESELIYDYFLHPNIMNEYYHGLCGAGVAYLLSRTLIGNYDKHTMLACVATIGDVVPLVNANRVIVRNGLQLLNTRNYMALQLLQNDTKQWNVKKVAFQVVPKLNCVGRMADEANVNILVRYLLLENDNQIQNMLYQINELNKKRKTISTVMEERAFTMMNDDDFEILYDPYFHEGINGIVASKLNRMTQKPVMILSEGNGMFKGSIRSNSVDLSVFFDGIKDRFIAYGGHKEAAGISFKKELLEEVKEYVKEKMKEEKKENCIEVLEVSRDEVTLEAIESLNILEPFGCGFEMPLFYIEDEIVKVDTLSKGKHIKYFGKGMQYLYFSRGNRFEKDQYLKKASFIGKVEINQFFHSKSVNMIVDYLVE